MCAKSKGISPLVAVIMLIAFTMIVAGILAGWATRFATEQRSMLEQCTRAGFKISKATYSASTQNVSLLVYNSGTVPLKNFQAMVTYDENGPAIPSTWNIYETVDANSFKTFEHDLPNKSVDYIEVRSVECQGAYDMIRGFRIDGLNP